MIKIIPAPLAAGAGAGGGNPFSYINIIAGTITTDTSPFTTTVTRNNAGVTFSAPWKLTIIETASAAGSLAMQILGGSTGATNIFQITKAGALTFPSDCNSGGNVVAGAAAIFAWAGRALMWSDSTENIRLTNNAGTNFGLLQLGGTSSSFPALKRSTTSLEIKLADDSAYTQLNALLFNTTSGGSTTISTGVGSVKMSSANPATNASWIPIAYAGTTYFVPGWTTNSP